MSYSTVLCSAQVLARPRFDYTEADFIDGELLVLRTYWHHDQCVQEEQRWRPGGALESRREYGLSGRLEKAFVW